MNRQQRSTLRTAIIVGVMFPIAGCYDLATPDFDWDPSTTAKDSASDSELLEVNDTSTETSTESDQDTGKDSDTVSDTETSTQEEPSGYCADHSCWSVPPTGQAACFDETQQVASCPGHQSGDTDCGDILLCGQDAQYHPPAERTFTDVLGPYNSHVIRDSWTGLYWEREYAHANSFGDAEAHCEQLNQLHHGGYADYGWRVPTVYELAGIANYGRDRPALYPLFTDWTSDPPLGPFWTSTRSALEAETQFWYRWAVAADDGDIRPSGLGSHVRCVHDGQSDMISHSRDPERFVIETETLDSIVVDQATGLEWQLEILPEQTWGEALFSCESSVYGGYTDWRLPDINELSSLVVFEIGRDEGPASDFPEMPESQFWSSTSQQRTGRVAWGVRFSNGEVSVSGYDKGGDEYREPDRHFARCVRGVLSWGWLFWL